jgi:hypothetical protein
MRASYRSQTLQDGAFLFVLGVTAIYGLHGSFSGWSYLIVGAVGLGFGIGLALLAKRRNQPLVVLAASVVGAFFALGGLVALHGLGGTSFLPVPHTLSELADTVVHGWKNLLTTIPPVDNGTLLTLPYLLGLVTGAVGMVVADRTRWAPAPAIVAGGLLAGVILLGVQHPSHVAADGAIFTGVALAWLMVRGQRSSRTHNWSGASRRVSRRISGALLCAGVTVLAALIGTHPPGFASTRTVLRSSIVPPFNVGQFPSPLASFRRFSRGYTELQPQDGLYGKPLLKVSALPAGSLIRIATLDSYDGNVWGAGDVAGSAVDNGPNSSDTFQKVGQAIDNPERGKQVTATVRILSNALGAWVPAAGRLTGITFTHPDEQTASNDFRYNLATSTGVMPQGLQAGNTYTFHAIIPDSTLKAKTLLASGSLPEVASYTQFQQVATRWVGHANTAIQQIDALASYLRVNGHYTDGGAGYQSFAAGHSLYRLSQFVSTGGELAGDDEQFAALMALMANELGVPARVVLGADLPASRIVTGADVHAWVELQAADGSWKTLPQTEFMGTLPPKKQSQKSKPSVPTSAIPPPAPQQPPATAGESLNNTVFHRTQGSKVTHPLPRAFVEILVYVGVPLLAILLLCSLIVALKVARRARRRSHGSPTRRLAFAWREFLDHARDFGLVAPARATRREQAAALDLPGAITSAARLDSEMFAHDPPSDESVAAYWLHTDELRRDLAFAYGRWHRLRASLSLASLRPRMTSRP